ncbi:uncharacterized protein LOC134631899 isoform X1 [Pelmatolapia mariae]|uniref:uncharacterized protein LOC134631899 isoform X1 n=1 Tax=Pelmatolapia mariae TaxID=158779 RepID=UPI002FE6401E
MATVTPRRLLIVKIQKRLCDLSVSQLRTVLSSVEDGSMTRNLDGLREPELYELIVEYIRGEKLRALEDEGMAQLLLLDDIVSDLLSTDVGGAGDHLAVPLEMEDIPNQQQECPTSPHTDPTHPDRHLAMPADHIPIPPSHPNTDSHTQPILPQDRDISTFPSSMLRDTDTPTKNFNIPASVSLAPSVAGVSPGRITKSTSEEAERLRRLGTASKARPVTVSAAQLANTDLTEQAKVDTELQANRAAIRELTAQVSSLTRQLTKVVSQTDSVTSGDSCSPLNHPPTPPAENRGRCGDCVQQGKVSCPHCFACGQPGHRAIGCLRRKVSGNGVRSLERGCQ